MSASFEGVQEMTVVVHMVVREMKSDDVLVLCAVAAGGMVSSYILPYTKCLPAPHNNLCCLPVVPCLPPAELSRSWRSSRASWEKRSVIVDFICVAVSFCPLSVLLLL